MKNKLLLFLTLFTFLASYNCYAENLTFAHFTKQILNINFLPEKEIHTTKILVLHPMVKDKLTELVATAKLVWKGGKCVKTIESFKQIKGKPVKGKSVVGESFDYVYVPKDIRAFCMRDDISGWKEDKTTLKLDDKSYPGYRFSVGMGDGKKDCSVFTDEKGALKAISMGFKGEKLNVENNSSQSSNTWYFGEKDGKLMLEKSIKVIAQKQNGIPFIKTETNVFK